jgi:hypothetical protein
MSAAKNDTVETEKETKKEDKKEEKKPVKPREYNPRDKGYILICLSSLVNLSAISNTKEGRGGYDGLWGLCLSCGWLTFSASLLILFFDRTQYCLETFNYTKAFDGKFEGYSLLFASLWWIFGVSYITQVNGIAYLAMNIYFSSWSTLIACIYTLNKWSSAKDILSIAELTGVSATLKSWYVLFISSLFVTGTSFDLFFRVSGSQKSNCALGFAVGIASSIISFMFILVHYNFILFFNEGGWVELCFSFLSILMWITGVAVLTKDDGVAATIMGAGCRGANFFDSNNVDLETSCTLTFLSTNDGEQRVFECSDVVDPSSLTQYIPGSNLYLAAWICLISSLNITFRWKAAQALQFAQAQNQRAMDTTRINDAEAGDLQDSDDDLDDFEDAVY